MAAITPASIVSTGIRPLTTTYGTSTANTDGTLSAVVTVPSRLRYVLVVYSGSPTQTGVTTALNSVIGASYDGTLNTGSANAKMTAWIPSDSIPLQIGDGIDVTALAGGSGQTAAIIIVTEAI